MKTLKLKWFLYFLGIKLAYHSRTNAAFQRVIANKELAIQIIIRDHALNYYFCFKSGQVIAVAGEHAAPSLLLTFADLRCANEVLRRCLSNMPKLIQYMNKGALTVEGDIGALIWFSALCEWAMEGQNASAYST